MSDNTPIAGPGFAAVETLDEETHLLQLLKIVNAVLEGGDATRALRYLDRAWRIAPRDTIIARDLRPSPLKARRAESRDRPSDRGAQQRPDPGAEAAIIEALLASANNNAANERLGAALRRFALVKGGALHTAARALLRQDGECHGWIGLTPELDFIGEVRGDLGVELSNFQGIALGVIIIASAECPPGRILDGTARSAAGRCVAGRGRRPSAAWQRPLLPARFPARRQSDGK